MFPSLHSCWKNFKPVVLVVVATFLLTFSSALGQTWSGLGGDGNWSTNANWVGSTPPVGGASIVMTTSTNLTTIQNIAALNSTGINSLLFDSSAGAFTVGGSTGLTINTGGNLTHNGSQPVSITTPVTMTGNTTLGGSGAGSLNLSSLTATNGTLTVSRNVTVGALGLSNPGTDPTATVVNTGGNVITLAGNVTFNGDDGNTSAPAILAGNINLGGATRTFIGSASTAASAPLIDLDVTAVITGTGGITKGGPNGAFTVPMYMRLSAANTYSGDTTLLGISGNRMYLGVVNAIPSNSAVVMGTGALLIMRNDDTAATSRNQSVGSLNAPASGGQILMGTATLTIGNDNTNASFGGQLSPGSGGTGNLIKVGSGRQILTNNNNYTGTTTVNGGALLVNGQTSSQSGTGTGPVTVNTGALFGGNGRSTGLVTVNSGATVRGGNENATGTLTLNGGLNLTASSTMAVRLVDGTTPASISTGSSSLGISPNFTSNNFINVTAGTLTINANTLFTIDGTGTSFLDGSTYSYIIAQRTGVSFASLNLSNQGAFSTIGMGGSNFSVTGSAGGQIFLNFTAVAVPEPTTWALMGLLTMGVGGVVWHKRRQQRQLLNQSL